jgi:hypothetical protein
LAPGGGSTVSFQTDRLKGNNKHNPNKIEILNIKSENSTKINDLMLNTSTQDRAQCGLCRLRSNSGEQLYTGDFLNGYSPSVLPPHTLDLKIKTIAIFLIFQQLKIFYNMVNLPSNLISFDDQHCSRTEV